MKPLTRNNNQREALLSQLQNNAKSLQQIFLTRKDIINRMHSLSQKEPELQTSYLNQINHHCQQYTKIRGVLSKINRSMNDTKHKDPVTDNAKFWELNQTMERDLQQRMRNLKSIDIAIDNVVNEQFDKCNQVDEIEETIRSILGKKQQNHIQKAEPYYLQKQRCMQFLRQKRAQKQKIKDVKNKTVRQILSVLCNLKTHRQSRLNFCTEKTLDNNSAKILQALIQDFQQISKAKETQQNILHNQKRFLDIIADTTNRIDRLITEIFDNVSQQAKAFSSLQGAMRDRVKISYFEKTILKETVPDLLNSQNQSKILLDLSQKYQRFLKTESQKGQEAQRIQQGITTTTDTISIFEHILEKIESQQVRRKNLLGKMQKMQERHNFQTSKQEQIAEFESEIERIQIRKNRLEKTLSAKIDEADVNAYKSTHSQIQALNKQLNRMVSTLQQMKEEGRQHAKLLYQQTNFIQDQFKDILSQVVPSVWFRDKDFTREETIRDLNLYLIKTFKRLSVAD